MVRDLVPSCVVVELRVVKSRDKGIRRDLKSSTKPLVEQIRIKRR